MPQHAVLLSGEYSSHIYLQTKVAEMERFLDLFQKFQ